MKLTMDLHSMPLKSTKAAIKQCVGFIFPILIGLLFSHAWLVFPGATVYSQRSSAPRDVVAEINVASLGSARQPLKLSGVTAKNSILAFSSLETYEKSYPIILSMNAEQSESWEKSLGFVSQRNIFNQIVKAEYAYLAAPYENKSDDTLRKMAAPKGHTDIYRRYLRSGLIRIQRTADGEETYTSAIPIGGYLPIINEQGYFIVGNTIYQIKDNFIKELTGFELSNLSELNNASSENAANGIKVQQVVQNPPPQLAKTASSCSYPLSSGWITSGNRRGLITVNFSKSYWNPYPFTKVNISYDVNVKSQKKNFWGNWVYPSCPNECWTSFSWTGVFDYMSKISLGYAGSTVSPRSYSYPHPNCMNDFKISLNPISSSMVPYPSSFTFTAPNGLAFLDVSLSNALWHASVPGGSSGITCNVGCP